MCSGYSQTPLSFSCKKTFEKKKDPTRKKQKVSKASARKDKKHARRLQEQHNNTKSIQVGFGICGRIKNNEQL